MVLGAALLNSEHYNVRITCSGAIQGKKLCPPIHLSIVAIEKGAFGSPLTTAANITLDVMMINKKEKNFKNVDFAVRADHKVEDLEIRDELWLSKLLLTLMW